jgi:hypothetical protein
MVLFDPFISTIAESSKASGMDGFDRAGVEAKHTSIQGNSLCGVTVTWHAKVLLGECKLVGSRRHNLEVSLPDAKFVACMVADSPEGCGLWVYHPTRVEAKDTIFRGSCQSGVYVGNKSSVFLDQCTVSGNKHTNVRAFSGVKVYLAGCTIADSLEVSGCEVFGKGTCVEARSSTFRGNSLYGVAAVEKASALQRVPQQVRGSRQPGIQ